MRVCLEKPARFNGFALIIAISGRKVSRSLPLVYSKAQGVAKEFQSLLGHSQADTDR